MIVTTTGAVTAGGTITIARLRRNIRKNSNAKQKGSLAAPLFANFAVSLRKHADYAYVSRATRTAKAVCSALVQL
jgi:hypothetical protein